MRVCIVYVHVVNEVALFRRLGQLMGMVHNRKRTRALQISRKKKERKLLVAYVETGTNS